MIIKFQVDYQLKKAGTFDYEYAPKKLEGTWSLAGGILEVQAISEEHAHMSTLGLSLYLKQKGQVADAIFRYCNSLAWGFEGPLSPPESHPEGGTSES